ncbi:hypothetical protein VTH06DRAFT_4122 [Thermothelomyces fergusii]
MPNVTCYDECRNPVVKPRDQRQAQQHHHHQHNVPQPGSAMTIAAGVGTVTIPFPEAAPPGPLLDGSIQRQ